jgi:hypothetical protein
VPVEPAHEHRVVGHERVDPRALGQRAAPPLVVPVAAEDPRPRGHRRREGADAFGELLRRARVAQLHARQAQPAVDEVHVRVGEAGDHHRAARVDHPRPGRAGGQLAGLGAPADERQPVAAHDHASAQGRRAAPVQTRAFTTASVTGPAGAVGAGLGAERGGGQDGDRAARGDGPSEDGRDRGGARRAHGAQDRVRTPSSRRPRDPRRGKFAT